MKKFTIDAKTYTFHSYSQEYNHIIAYLQESDVYQKTIIINLDPPINSYNITTITNYRFFDFKNKIFYKHGIWQKTCKLLKIFYGGILLQENGKYYIMFDVDFYDLYKVPVVSSLFAQINLASLYISDKNPNMFETIYNGTLTDDTWMDYLRNNFVPMYDLITRNIVYIFVGKKLPDKNDNGVNPDHHYLFAAPKLTYDHYYEANAVRNLFRGAA